jgi:hypothetical protein
VTSNRPLHLTAPGRARARPSRAVLSLTRVPQVSGQALIWLESVKLGRLLPTSPL